MTLCMLGAQTGRICREKAVHVSLRGSRLARQEAHALTKTGSATQQCSGQGAHLKVLRATSLYKCHSIQVLSRLAESRNKLPLHDRSNTSSWWPKNSFRAGVLNTSVLCPSPLSGPPSASGSAPSAAKTTAVSVHVTLDYTQYSGSHTSCMYMSIRNTCATSRNLI